jgi:hypothetical protein
MFGFLNIIGKFLKNGKQGFSNRNHKVYFPTSWMFSVTHFMSLNPLFYPEPHNSMSRWLIMVKSEKSIYFVIVITAVRTESMRFNRRKMKAKLNTWAISDFLAPCANIPLG